MLALGDARVYGGFYDSLLDAAGGFVAAAVFADAVGCDGLSSVFVFGDGLGGEGELVVVVFFGPIGAAIECQAFLRVIDSVDSVAISARVSAGAQGGVWCIDICLPCWS